MAEELDRRPEEHWQDIVREVEQEANPTRIRTLAHELNEAMLREQRSKVAQKLERTTSADPLRTNYS